jgi:hypothetical protein
MQTMDYNGTGRWSLEAIRQRYHEYARRFHVAKPLDLAPREHSDGQKRWIYPVMGCVIDGIKSGDAACIELGVEFIECDEKFPFGKILKSRAARELRKADVTSHHMQRIRKRVIDMLIAGHVPREFADYARLLRKVGVGPDWANVKKQLDRSNSYVMKFFEYLDASASSGECHISRAQD